MQDKLVKRGYAAAFDNAGSLLLHQKTAGSIVWKKP